MQNPVDKGNILNRAYTHAGIGHWRTPPNTYCSGGGMRLQNVFVTTYIYAGGLTASKGGARYHPLTPAVSLTPAMRRPPWPGATMDLQVTGAGGVPSTGVSAVVLNVAVTSPTASSYLTVFPAGEARPLAANLNYIAGETVPNMVTAKLGAGGRLSVYNSVGSTQIIADVAGWYDDAATATGARYHPLTPRRILDTRSTRGGRHRRRARSVHRSRRRTSAARRHRRTAQARVEITRTCVELHGRISAW